MSCAVHLFLRFQCTPHLTYCFVCDLWHEDLALGCTEPHYFTMERYSHTIIKSMLNWIDGVVLYSIWLYNSSREQVGPTLALSIDCQLCLASGHSVVLYRANQVGCTSVLHLYMSQQIKSLMSQFLIDVQNRFEIWGKNRKESESRGGDVLEEWMGPMTGAP